MITYPTKVLPNGYTELEYIEIRTIAELKKRYIRDKEVKRVYIGDNLVWKNN